MKTKPAVHPRASLLRGLSAIAAKSAAAAARAAGLPARRCFGFVTSWRLTDATAADVDANSTPRITRLTMGFMMDLFFSGSFTVAPKRR
ncbi:MAG: hypothetical protein WD066_08185 [Planctomycetaceae bacterium]